MDGYQWAILNLGPVAYWPLDDAGTWADATGNGHNLTANGTVNTGTSIRAGVTRDCADLAGGYFTAADDAALRPENMADGFTYVITYQADTLNTWNTLMAKNRVTGNDGAYLKHRSYIGVQTIDGYINSPTAIIETDDYPTAYATGVTYTVAFVYDVANSLILLYADGVEVDTTSASGFSWGTTDTSGVDFYIGANIVGAEKLDGRVQDVAVFDYPLSATEVASLMEPVNLGGEIERPGSGSLREAVQRIANSAAGRFYAAKDGTVTVEWRDAEAGKSVALTLNSEQTSPWVSGVTASPGFAETVNEVVLRMADGSEVRAQAAERAAVVESTSLVLETLLVNQSDADDLAQFLADYSARPSRVITDLVCYPQGWGSYDPVLAALLELGSRVQVNLPDGDVFDGTVERIAWDFDGAAVLRLGLDRYDPGGFGNADWFVIDSSALDGADVLAY